MHVQVNDSAQVSHRHSALGNRRSASEYDPEADAFFNLLAC